MYGVKQCGIYTLLRVFHNRSRHLKESGTTNTSEKRLSHPFEVRGYVSLYDSTSLKFASFKRLVKFTGSWWHTHILACPAVLRVLVLSKSA